MNPQSGPAQSCEARNARTRRGLGLLVVTAACAFDKLHPALECDEFAALCDDTEDALALSHREPQLHIEQLVHQLFLVELAVAIAVDACEELAERLAALCKGEAHFGRHLPCAGDTNRHIQAVAAPQPRIARDACAHAPRHIVCRVDTRNTVLR